MNDQRRLYADLAWTWPIISPPEEYVDEAEVFERHIHQRSPRARTLLHLGCGGGHIDYTLKKHFDITGVDISDDMLSLARRLNPDVEYLLGDMRSVRLDRVFDAVVIADSIAYMLTESELRAAFETAFVHLRAGGVFLTYAEATREHFKQNQTECSVYARGDVEIAFVENYYDPDPADTVFDATYVYLIRRGGRLNVETDHHIVGLFPLATWQRLLKEVGFEVEQVEFEEGIPLFVGLKLLAVSH